jgi:hypothetical protein
MFNRFSSFANVLLAMIPMVALGYAALLDAVRAV